MKRLKNKEDVLKDLSFNGQSVAGWAREHGFTHATVRRVINGEISCRMGASHNIAVLLGMKEGVIREEGAARARVGHENA